MPTLKHLILGNMLYSGYSWPQILSIVALTPSLSVLQVHYNNLTHITPFNVELLANLTELDLVTMRLENIRSLLEVIGARLERLTVECDEEQGSGSEIVHIARSCPNITSLRLLLGDKVLKGEQTLHFGQTFFRKLERLTIEGNVHLHGFAFLWGHCQYLKYIRIGEFLFVFLNLPAFIIFLLYYLIWRSSEDAFLILLTQ